MSEDEEPVDVGQAIADLTRAVWYLGNGSASTPFGAIEAHGMMIEKLAEAVTGAGDAVAEGLRAIAEAIRPEIP